MSPNQAITHFGTQVKVAAALGITQPTVSRWLTEGYIPILRQYQIQHVTQGVLTVDEVSPERDTSRSCAT